MRKGIKRNSLVEKKPQNKISYEDLLNNMGLHVDNGKLHTSYQTCSLKGKGAEVKMECSKVKCGKLQQNTANKTSSNVNVNNHPVIPQNSYIYNKYFKEHLKPSETTFVPKTREEYNQYILQKLLEKRLQQIRISQIKNTKLIMPTNNINIAPSQSNNPLQLDRFFRSPLNKYDPNLIYSSKK